jgi:hypothetical protein
MADPSDILLLIPSTTPHTSIASSCRQSNMIWSPVTSSLRYAFNRALANVHERLVLDVDTLSCDPYIHAAP